MKIRKIADMIFSPTGLKTLASAALSIMFAVLTCFNAGAAGTNQYGLGLTVSEENGCLSAEVKNYNSFDVNNVSLVFESETPLKTGGIIDSSVDLKPGERINASARPIILEGAGTKNEKNNGGIPLSATTAVIAAAVTAVLLLIMKKHKRSRKALCLIFAVSLLVPTTGRLAAEAAEDPVSKSFSYAATVKSAGKCSEINVKVNYDENTDKKDYFELESDLPEKDESLVKDAALGVKGFAAACGTVEKVEYEICSKVDGFAPSQKGELTLNGCEFDASDLNLKLKPGENRISITATLTDGTTRRQIISETYDNGELYCYKADEVKSEEGIDYVDGIIDVYFSPEIKSEEAEAIIKEAGGETVGAVYGAGLYQVKVEASGYNELLKVCSDYESIPGVSSSLPERIFEFDDNTVYYPDEPAYSNDPFDHINSAGTLWNEDLPNGNNWPQECLRAPSTWAYNAYYNNVKVGVVDSAFYDEHEDFDEGVILYPDGLYDTSYSAGADANHGTHVTSLIAATQNNELGIAGMVNDVNVYAASYKTEGTIAYIVECFTEEVECGAKVVNLSIGISREFDANHPDINPYTNLDSDSSLATTATPCVSAMNTLLTNGYDFVVVQSAGNGATDTRLGTTTSAKRSVDAYQNGLFCSVKSQRYGTITQQKAAACYNRIIVVGAIENKTNAEGAAFRMVSFSNGGDRVDVYAPGRSVFGCITDTLSGTVTYHYAFLSGTSQAAPLVSGIAALCFAAAPNLTGAQVKSIICNDANSEYIAYDNDDAYTGTPIEEGANTELHPFTQDGKVASAYLCVNAALQTSRPLADYTYLNRYVNTILREDPDDYTNFDTVQNVIDSIDYNIKDYQQSVVDAKRQELLGAIEGLIERSPADYTQVDAAIAQAEALDELLYEDFSAVSAAVNAVARGKHAEDQAEVDAMAQAILDAIGNLTVSQGINSLDGEVTIDTDRHLIIATADKIDGITSVFEPCNGWTISALPNQNGFYSTGATITAGRNGTTVTYTVSILGDLDGNAKIEGYDALIISAITCGALNMTEAQILEAADADCSGDIDINDFKLTEAAALEGDGLIINTN